MKTILKNLENYGQLTLSIAYLKVLYYSIMNEVMVSVRNTTGNDFALIMRIDSKDVEKWVAQMSANHSFKYEVRNRNWNSNNEQIFILKK